MSLISANITNNLNRNYRCRMLLIFRENTFLMYDFSKNSSWQVGDCESKHFMVDEDAHIVMVDP